MTYQTETITGGFSFGDRIAALRTALTARRANHKIYTTTLRELQDLTDRDLADLGMSRSMIKSVALEAAYGK
ncbi:DUF1127 domain-containing protein [Yoonia sp.]|uniref:DUF1127 domain-containing protein n=1 Tax=Yoonia sp. TaxID=2212373 RepID=UPI001A0396EE|nr:DUF1127 domain-containing protein [Yoonia sp.]MBE0414012.1 DUF1127 domain-containing protein [Yoonia sp.]